LRILKRALHRRAFLFRRNFPTPEKWYGVLSCGSFPRIFPGAGKFCDFPLKDSERVASGLARECKAFLKSTAPVGAYLSDQLMVPLALGEGGRYRTPSPLTLHAITNAEVIQKFLDVEITLIDMDDETSEITIQPSSSAS
jgi:hypothetical protein